MRQELSAHTHGAYQTPRSPSSPAATALRVAQSLHRDIKDTKAGETREVSVLGAPLPLSQLSPLLTPGYGSDPSEPTPPDPGCSSRHIPTTETKQDEEHTGHGSPRARTGSGNVHGIFFRADAGREAEVPDLGTGMKGGNAGKKDTQVGKP